MNANQPDRPGLARNADALKTLMPLGNNRHRPLLSRTLTPNPLVVGSSRAGRAGNASQAR